MLVVCVILFDDFLGLYVWPSGVWSESYVFPGRQPFPCEHSAGCTELVAACNELGVKGAYALCAHAPEARGNSSLHAWRNIF